MEVKPGYKQTEVGVIPEDWESFTIQELINQGAVVGHIDGNHGELYPRSHEFKAFGVPYITANDLCGHKVSFSNCKYLSLDRARRFRKGVAKSGDVLFAHNATVGPTALLSTEIDYVILSTTVTYFRCNPEKLVNSIFLYVLQSPFFVRQYQKIMSQSTRNQVPITAQRKLTVTLPPTIAEQEAIAEALSDVDALLEALDRLIAKKRQIKQGTMQELLTGKRRLPGFSGEWEVKRLGEVVAIRKGQLITEKTLVVGDVPVIAGGKKPAYYNNRANRDGKTITVSASGASAGYVAFFDTPIFASDCSTIGESESYSIEFIFFQLQLKQEQIYKAQTGGAQPHIHPTDLAPIEIGFPSLPEQATIATVLSEMDAEIAALELKRDKTRALKQGMMQELLTGRIRLI